MGKAFEKQTKTIQDQGKKQIDALANLKPKEIKPKEIRRSFEPINFYNIIYNFKDPNIPPEKFIKFKGPNAISKDIHDGKTTLEDVESEQKKTQNKTRLHKTRKSKK